MSSSNSDNIFCERTKFPVASAMLRIHQSTSKSILTVKQVYSKYERRSVIVHKTARHSLCIAASSLSSSSSVRDQYPTGLLLPSSCSCRSTNQICLTQESVSSVYWHLLLSTSSTFTLIATSLEDATAAFSVSS